MEGCLFTTNSGLDYTYRIKAEEIVIDGESVRLSRDQVMSAYMVFMNLKTHGEECEGSNSVEDKYLFPVFNKMGLTQNS